jgi:ATP-dependent DNA helicase RecG
MTELELKKHIQLNFPKENEKCEWKEFKSLKHAITGQAGGDVISYISAIANMKGGHLIIGIKDGTLDIVGIHEFADYTIDNI